MVKDGALTCPSSETARTRTQGCGSRAVEQKKGRPRPWQQRPASGGKTLAIILRWQRWRSGSLVPTHQAAFLWATSRSSCWPASSATWWCGTSHLHCNTPLMSVTNAISSIIAIGALVQIAPLKFMRERTPGRAHPWLAFAAIVLTAINMFGGFAVTRRMLAMFRK